MKKTIIGLFIVCVCALIVAAINFDPGGDIDMKNRWDINNGGNITAQRVGIINAPAACPEGYMTYYNGSVSTCTKFSAANINASTKNVTVQCIRFDSGGLICSS